MVNVVAVCEEVFAVLRAPVCEAFLPDRKLGSEAPGEAAFDELHRPFKSNTCWGEEKMDVVWHDDESMEFVVAFMAIVLESFEEELTVGFNLEEPSSVMSLCGDKEGAVAGESLRNGHGIGQAYFSG